MVDRGDSNSVRLEANGNGNGFGNAENHTGSNRRDRHAQSQFSAERTETVRIPLNATQKVFVCRDYTQGLDIRFLRDFPPSLSPFIAEETWEHTITRINSIFQTADKVCFASVMETLLGCATCYTIRLFSKTIYEKQLIELDEFLKRQNEEIYNPVGLHVLNPMERGLRVIEISLLNVPAAEDSTDLMQQNQRLSP
ncbi:hypothetical protein WR25_03277 [Diploscapter pachys]|uniref:Ras modification protein ERF4 n=1 Tax=Diploscapter pachys TaxID=2018661 RepID=A0A2A2JQI4_9BILA|nr:hypothetical protein WR25_03277 [Diploscapter pachys]